LCLFLPHFLFSFDQPINNKVIDQELIDLGSIRGRGRILYSVTTAQTGPAARLAFSLVCAGELVPKNKQSLSNAEGRNARVVPPLSLCTFRVCGVQTLVKLKCYLFVQFAKTVEDDWLKRLE
jgi:hypothetical protein